MDFDKKLKDIRRLDELSMKESVIHDINTLVMLIVTIVYIFILMSFDRYDITGILMMILYPFFMFRMSELSFSESLKKMRLILPLILFLGIFEIIFDRSPYLRIGGFTVTKGSISFLNLFIKGFLAVEASYILIATHSIYRICGALSFIHVPNIIVSLFLLTYRYISVMIEEVSQMSEAYFLRAPGQKGLHISSWGSFLGQLLLRSFDRADELYSSMLIRGYTGDLRVYMDESFKKNDILFLVICLSFFIVSRLFNIPVTIGNFIRRPL